MTAQKRLLGRGLFELRPETGRVGPRNDSIRLTRLQSLNREWGRGRGLRSHHWPRSYPAWTRAMPPVRSDRHGISCARPRRRDWPAPQSSAPLLRRELRRRGRRCRRGRRRENIRSQSRPEFRRYRGAEASLRPRRTPRTPGQLGGRLTTTTPLRGSSVPLGAIVGEAVVASPRGRRRGGGRRRRPVAPAAPLGANRPPLAGDAAVVAATGRPPRRPC